MIGFIGSPYDDLIARCVDAKLAPNEAECRKRFPPPAAPVTSPAEQAAYAKCRETADDAYCRQEIDSKRDDAGVWCDGTLEISVDAQGVHHKRCTPQSVVDAKVKQQMALLQQQYAATGKVPSNLNASSPPWLLLGALAAAAVGGYLLLRN